MTCEPMVPGGGQTVAHDGSKPPFDTLTVFNAALNFRMNWEGNFSGPRGHMSESSLENPVNMRTSVDEVLRKLNADPQMVQQFSRGPTGVRRIAPASWTPLVTF